MEDHNSRKEQDEELKRMDYNSSEDIFNQEKSVSMDSNGEIQEDAISSDSMEMDLDVPGSELDNLQELIGEEDEENNYWSLSDQDDHEEQNDDIIQ